jgi:hypothetical protein
LSIDSDGVRVLDETHTAVVETGERLCHRGGVAVPLRLRRYGKEEVLHTGERNDVDDAMQGR